MLMRRSQLAIGSWQLALACGYDFFEFTKTQVLSNFRLMISIGDRFSLFRFYPRRSA